MRFVNDGRPYYHCLMNLPSGGIIYGSSLDQTWYIWRRTQTCSPSQQSSFPDSDRSTIYHYTCETFNTKDFQHKCNVITPSLLPSLPSSILCSILSSIPLFPSPFSPSSSLSFFPFSLPPFPPFSLPLGLLSFLLPPSLISFLSFLIKEILDVVLACCVVHLPVLSYVQETAGQCWRLNQKMKKQQL